VRAWRSGLARVAASPAAPYVGAVALRTAARAVWGLALPAAFSMAAYGRYQLFATIAAMAAQLAVLGAPQTIVRHAGRRVPMAALVMHAGALGAVAIAAAAAFVPAARSPIAVGVLAAAVLAAVAAALFGARAKARLAFATSCYAEALGAAVLVLTAALLALSTAARTRLSPWSAMLIESLALAATAAALLRARPNRSPHARADDAPPPARALFGDVYSVGALVLLDVVLFRRLEVYFLERSPDGLAGVAVLGLSLQIASVALLVPSALLEAWQPRLALVRGGEGGAFEHEVRRRAKQFAPLMLAVTLLGTAVPLVAIPLVFPQYRPWLWYVVAFVAIRLACAGAGLYSAALYAVGRQRVLYAPAVIGALVAILTNATLTRHTGLRGALVAYATTQLVVAGLTVAAYYRGSAWRERAPVPAPVAIG